MTTYSAGITAILARMDSNPSEFFGEAPKWRFIFKETFREVLTEPEKGALHEKLKEVRRQEFDHQVMRTLLDSEMQETTLGGWKEPNLWGNSISGNSMLGSSTSRQAAVDAALKQQTQNQAAARNRGMLG